MELFCTSVPEYQQFVLANSFVPEQVWLRGSPSHIVVNIRLSVYKTRSMTLDAERLDAACVEYDVRLRTQHIASQRERLERGASGASFSF